MASTRMCPVRTLIQAQPECPRRGSHLSGLGRGASRSLNELSPQVPLSIVVSAPVPATETGLSFAAGVPTQISGPEGVLTESTTFTWADGCCPQPLEPSAPPTPSASKAESLERHTHMPIRVRFSTVRGRLRRGRCSRPSQASSRGKVLAPSSQEKEQAPIPGRFRVGFEVRDPSVWLGRPNG